VLLLHPIQPFLVNGLVYFNGFVVNNHVDPFLNLCSVLLPITFTLG